MRDHADTTWHLPIPTVSAAIDVDQSICDQLVGKLVRRPGHQEAPIVAITPRKSNPKFELLVAGHSMLFSSIALHMGELVLDTGTNDDDRELMETIQNLSRMTTVLETKAIVEPRIPSRNTKGVDDRLCQLLEKRQSGSSPSDADLNYLLRIEQFEVGAEWLEETFRHTGTVGIAAKSSRWWRMAALPANSLRVTSSVETDPKHAKARMLWTTRGAAYTDLHEFGNAIRCGTEAVALGPDDYFPCNMLGRAHGLKGDFKESCLWFHRALGLERDKKGESTPVIEVAKSLRGALNEVPNDQQSAWLDYLKSFDQELFELASEFRQFNPARRSQNDRFYDVPF